jgi:hypothetical protein
MPPSERPPELATTAQFCKEFDCRVADLYAFMTEVGFMEDVTRSIDHWKSRCATVIDSARKNAEDRQRPDQLTWVCAFLTIAKHPSADSLRALLPEP